MAEDKDREHSEVNEEEHTVHGHGWHAHHHKHRSQAEVIDDEDDVEGHGWHAHHHKH